MSDSDADTCHKLVAPRLQQAGWDNEPYSIAQRRTIMGGHIVPVEIGFVSSPPRRPHAVHPAFLDRAFKGEL